jgi:hypothetical protein
MKPFTDEWYKKQEELHLQAAMEKVEREKRLQDPNSQFGTWDKDAKGVPSWNKWGDEDGGGGKW